MNLKKLFLGIVISILSINAVFTQTAYDDDAAEVDYYVPGILANDAMSQVNFLLCFVCPTFVNLTSTQIYYVVNVCQYRSIKFIFFWIPIVF